MLTLCCDDDNETVIKSSTHMLLQLCSKFKAAVKMKAKNASILQKSNFAGVRNLWRPTLNASNCSIVCECVPCVEPDQTEHDIDDRIHRRASPVPSPTETLHPTPSVSENQILPTPTSRHTSIAALITRSCSYSYHYVCSGITVLNATGALKRCDQQYRLTLPSVAAEYMC